MKKTTGIFMAAAVILSFAAVFVVQAQDAGVVNANSNENTALSTNGNANSDTAANANENANENVNTDANLPPPPETVSVNAPSEGSDEQSLPPPEPTLYSGNMPPADGAVSGTIQKIPAPEHIKLYTNIRRVGNSLFGILKNIRNEAMSGSAQSSAAQNGASSSGSNPAAAQNLEKILSPDLIKFFTGIKKVGNSLFGKRIAGSAPQRTVTAEESACVISAIKAKDQAVVSSVNAYAASFAAAVSSRTDCQTAALSTVEGQREALAKCAKSFTAAAGQAKATQTKAQSSAWSAYRAALRACAPSVNANANAPTSGGEIMIEDGGDSL